jgi:hypothetical protein
MFIRCEKCKEDVEVVVDTDTLVNKQVAKTTVAVCPECKSPFSLSSFALKSLISMKRFYSKPKKSSAFSFPCKTCEKDTKAILSEDRKSAYCATCSETFALSSFMIQAMIKVKEI